MYRMSSRIQKIDKIITHADRNFITKQKEEKQTEIEIKERQFP